MTCIVGVSNGTDVWLGSDQAISRESNREVLLDSEGKVFVWERTTGNIVVGVTNNYGWTQHLHYTDLLPPELEPNEPVEHYVRVTLRRYFFTQWAAYEQPNKSTDTGCDMLVGLMGRLYLFTNALIVVRAPGGRYAVGSGGPFARGALMAMETWAPMHPEMTIEGALDIACRCVSTCRGPYTIVSTCAAAALESVA